MATNGHTNGNGSKKKDPVLVVVQLSGGNDFMNTVIPFTERPLLRRAAAGARAARDSRCRSPTRSPSTRPRRPLRDMYLAGDVAIVQGIGYENSSRSHFRAMDIWHTCEPLKIATEGWLAKVIQEIDPQGSNPLTGVSFGRGLPRALAAPGVTATSVDNLDNYGLLNTVQVAEQRQEDLQFFKRMYTPAIGTGMVLDYLAHTGNGVLRRRRHAEGGPGLLHLDGHVPGLRHRQVAARRGPGPHRQPRHARLLHPARRLRLPRPGSPEPPPPADRADRRRSPRSCRTCASTTPRTTSPSWCSPSSAGG